MLKAGRPDTNWLQRPPIQKTQKINTEKHKAVTKTVECLLTLLKNVDTE